MKPTRLTMIGVGVLGIALVVWLVLMLASGESKKTAAAQGDDKHCPNCGRELSATAIANGECPSCAMEYGPEKGKLKNETSLAANPVIPITLFSVFGLLLAVHVGLVIRARTGQGNKDEPTFHIRCRKCGRKLGYRLRQVGQGGKCPLCRNPTVFPRPAEGEKGNRWVRFAHYIWG